MKLDFRILSNRKCHFPGCPKRLKQSLIDKNPDAEYCYKHNKEITKAGLKLLSKMKLNNK